MGDMWRTVSRAACYCTPKTCSGGPKSGSRDTMKLTADRPYADPKRPRAVSWSTPRLSRSSRTAGSISRRSTGRSCTAIKLPGRIQKAGLDLAIERGWFRFTRAARSSGSRRPALSCLLGLTWRLPLSRVQLTCRAGRDTSGLDPERTWATFPSGRFITNVATRTGSAQVRRRDLLKLTGGMAVAWPISTHAQQRSAVRHVGVFFRAQ